MILGAAFGVSFQLAIVGVIFVAVAITAVFPQ